MRIKLEDVLIEIEDKNAKIFDKEIFVSLNFQSKQNPNSILGHANNFKVKEDGLYCDILFYNNQFDIKNVLLLTPAVGGQVNPVVQKDVVSKNLMNINMIGLCTNTNNDKRILTLAEQLK